MKKTILFLLASSTLSPGALLLNEEFSYADGNLVPNGGWTTHSGTAGQIQVSAGAITLTDSQSEDVNVPLGITLTTGSVYGAFDFTVTAGAVVGGTDFEYFASFGNGTADFTARVDVVAPTGGGDFTLGISGGSGTAQDTWGSDLTFSTTYRALIKYDRDSGIASLYVDPASEASASVSGTADTNDVTNFYFRESNSSANETIVIDNLRVATTFSEALVVPEPSSTALLGLGGLALLIRRKR
ncbi:MAG: PEP-CTERM sorting domain-containing protein [Akkermansiaceae bacterium]